MGESSAEAAGGGAGAPSRDFFGGGACSTRHSKWMTKTSERKGRLPPLHTRLLPYAEWVSRNNFQEGHPLPGSRRWARAPASEIYGDAILHIIHTHTSRGTCQPREERTHRRTILALCVLIRSLALAMGLIRRHLKTYCCPPQYTHGALEASFWSSAPRKRCVAWTQMRDGNGVRLSGLRLNAHVEKAWGKDCFRNILFKVSAVK